MAGSFGTALLVSISSAVTGMLGTGSTEAVFAGYHASFCTTAGLSIVAVALIVFFVRDKEAQPAQESAAQLAMQETPGLVRVADAMNAAAAKVLNTASMREVIDLMSRMDTTGVSVVSDTGELVGYVTDGDVARYLARHDKSYSSPSSGFMGFVADDGDLKERLSDLASLNVMELATKHVITADANMPLDKACSILSDRRIKKVPVLQNGVLVGALSRRNVMHYMMGKLEV